MGRARQWKFVIFGGGGGVPSCACHVVSGFGFRGKRDRKRHVMYTQTRMVTNPCLSRRTAVSKQGKQLLSSRSRATIDISLRLTARRLCLTAGAEHFRPSCLLPDARCHPSLPSTLAEPEGPGHHLEVGSPGIRDVVARHTRVPPEVGGPLTLPTHVSPHPDTCSASSFDRGHTPLMSTRV